MDCFPGSCLSLPHGLSHRSIINSAYISPRLIFGKWFFFFFHLVLSEYANQSHNFTNLNFCDVTVLPSTIVLVLSQTEFIK